MMSFMLLMQNFNKVSKASSIIKKHHIFFSILLNYYYLSNTKLLINIAFIIIYLKKVCLCLRFYYMQFYEKLKMNFNFRYVTISIL